MRVVIANNGVCTDYLDVIARAQGGNLNGNKYFARLSVAANRWLLGKTISGSDSAISGNSASFNYTTVEFVLSGSTLSLVADTVTVLSVTDTDIAAAGVIGFQYPLNSGNGTSAIPTIETFEADAVSWTGSAATSQPTIFIRHQTSARRRGR